MNQFKPLGGARTRDTRRRDNGTRDTLTARIEPVAGARWFATLEDTEADYTAEASTPGCAVDAAYRAMLEATGRTRTLGHGKGRAA